MTQNQHLLLCLAEECNEVAQRVSKALRFGLSEVREGQPDDNAERIAQEMDDLRAVYEMLVHRGVLRLGDEDRVCAKVYKVTRYLDYSRSVGALESDHA